MKRRFVLMALLAVTALALGLYINKEKDSTAAFEKVRINIVTWPGYGPIFVAQDKGFFKDEGVDVDVQIQENTQARHAALAAGQIDLVGITLESVVLAASQGIPMQVIGISDISDGGDGIVAKSGIQTIADLKGKKVAFPEGQPSHLFLLYHLDKAGMKGADIVPVLTDDAGKAGEVFTAGQADAAVTWEPWLSQVTSSGKGGLLVSSKGAKDILIGILAANSDKLAGNSGKLAKFLKGWYRGLEFIQSHRKESLPIIAKGLGIPEADIDSMLMGLRFVGKPEAQTLLGAGDGQAGFLPIAKYEEELWRKNGVITKPVDAAKVFTGIIIKGL